MKGQPITTSALAGMGPAALNSPMIFSQDAMVPLAFQFPPSKYVRVPAAAGEPLEELSGRESVEKAMVVGMLSIRELIIKKLLPLIFSA